MFGCRTSAQPIFIVNAKAALWHPLQHTDEVHRLHGQDVEDLNTASCCPLFAFNHLGNMSLKGLAEERHF